MRVLVIAPHPDDEVLGCGGVMARHATNGDDVHVVVGTRGIEEKFPAAFIDKIRSELANAHAVLGVQRVKYLDFPAPCLDTVPRYKIADALAAIFAEFKPSMIYVPHHGDIHADHGHLYHAALVAARPIAGCPVKRILAYETLSETEWAPPEAGSVFFPTVFVNIETHLQQKLDAMACYQSQLKEPPNPRSLSNIESLARLRGATVNMHAAEAFMLIRDVLD